MNLTQTTAIVTGGCSGLGHATAIALRAAGMNVALFDLNEALGAQRVEELGPDNTAFFKVDVCDEYAVKTAIEAATVKLGDVRLVVNCAGVAPAARVLNRDGEPADQSQFEKTLQINLFGTYNVSRLAAAYMAKLPAEGEAKERGVIINTASVAGFDGQIGQTAYAASKGAIISLTLPMARDLAPSGIRVNTVAPGVMGTPLLLGMPEKVQDALVANVQFPKRLGLPEEFAKLIIHIAENSYINGETIRLDGALRMPPK